MAPVILIIVSLSVVVVVVRKLFQNKGKLAQECQELHFLSPLKKENKDFSFSFFPSKNLNVTGFYNDNKDPAMLLGNETIREGKKEK
jgi:hypothetical protein